MAPKISVIVPVYNVKDYLDICLQSVVAQTCHDIEIILIDDGSNDGCGAFCDDWAQKDDRIRVIHQQNQGLSAARNTGIKVAKGEYLSFVDSDDWMEPQMLENMQTAVEQHNSDIVVCRGQFVEPDGKVTKTVGFDALKVMSKIEASKEILKDEEIPSFAWNKIYRRRLFDCIEYPVGRLFEDTFTTYKLFYKAEKIVCIPYIGYNYRSNPESITRQRRSDVEKFIKRDLDNALAFDERYLFAKTHKDLEEVVPICAYKAYQMIHAFIHLCEHKKFQLTEQQKAEIDHVLKTMEVKDLSLFSLYDKLDLILYKIHKSLLKFYLRAIAIIRPIDFEIK